jgi:hypothetical protein
MKKPMLLIVLAIFAASCGNDPDPKPNPKIDEVQGIVTTGKWRISYFFDTDEEETDKYTNYAFQFLPNGSLVANDGPASLSGAWSVTDRGNSNDDNNQNDVDFNISFTSTPLLDELSDDWEIVSVSNTKLELRHISGGNGGTDLLTFEKI